jgi:hypothetical protein
MRATAGTVLLGSLMTIVAAHDDASAAGEPPRPGAAATTVDRVVADDDWLSIVNAYRAMSGLVPVREDAGWSAEARAHSCYMLRNGIGHDETPGQPGYTTGGDTAGNNGNVAVSSAVGATARQHVELWMTGPFHAIGVLRHGLRTTGFGMCADPTTGPWRSGATLDVVRGVDPAAPARTTPVLFPGPGATVRMGAFVTESPDPVRLCGWSGAAGLPLVAMMPAHVSAASASLTGPHGPIDTCVLHAANTPDAHARAVLDHDDAVVVVPRTPLPPGAYTATVRSTGGEATWSFAVDPSVTLTTPDVVLPTTSVTSAPVGFDPVVPFRHTDSRAGRAATRLRAGVPQTIRIADADVAAVSANVTVDRPAAPGFLTAYPCTPDVPVVSTLNFTDSAVPNQAVLPLAAGRLCLVASADTDVIIDVNGWFRADGAVGYHALEARRLVDTRTGGPIGAGEVREVRVEGVRGGAPHEAVAVAVNLTAVGPVGDGFVRAYPCGADASEVSNVNVRAGRDRPNSAIVPSSPDGTICIVSSVATHLLVDVAGYVAPGGLRVRSVEPLRLLDTRSGVAELNPATHTGAVRPGQVVRVPVAGRRGVPADALAAVVNLTAVDPAAAGFVTAFDCGDVPTVSNLNTDPRAPAVANGAIVRLDPDGAMCLVADHATHLVVDIVGVWA